MTKNKQTNKDPCLNGSGGGCSMTSPVLFTFLVQNFPFFFFLNISILLIVPEILITYSNALLPSPYILLEEPQKKEKKKNTTSLRVPVMVVPTCQSLAEAEACDNSDARGDNS